MSGLAMSPEGIAYALRHLRRVALTLLILCCGCSADKANGPSLPPSVTLSATPDHITEAGNIILTAAVTTHGTSVQRVEFSERIGADTFVVINNFAAPPYVMAIPVFNADENDDRVFVAKVYDDAGRMNSSNTVSVPVNVIDTRPLEAQFSVQSRLTSYGKLVFSGSSNKTLAKLELYEGAKQLVAMDAPQPPYSMYLMLTSADNGTHNYVVKATDKIGNVVSSAVLPVVVDILWDDEVELRALGWSTVVWLTRDVTDAIYAAGAIASVPNVNATSDAAIAKFDGSGQRQWLRTFGSSNVAESANSVGIDPKGRPYITGCTSSATSPPIVTCFVVVYDALGNIVRTIATLDGGRYGGFDSSGNYYAAGNPSDSNRPTVRVSKYDASGNLVWTQEPRSTQYAAVDFPADEVYGIAVDGAGAVYVAGRTTGSFLGAPTRSVGTPFVLKFDSAGNRLWASQYDSANVHTAVSHIMLGPDGGVYVAAGIWSADDQWALGEDALILRFEPNGQLGWSRTLNGGSVEWGTDVVADQRGVYFIGSAFSGDTAHDFKEPRLPESGFVARFDRGGSLQWIRLGNITNPARGVLTSTGDLWVGGWGIFENHGGPAIARLHLSP